MDYVAAGDKILALWHTVTTITQCIQAYTQIK